MTKLEIKTLPPFWQEKWQQGQLVAVIDTKNDTNFQAFEYKIFEIKKEDNKGV